MQVVKSNRGGSREGAGRPKAAPTVTVRTRLTLDQHAQYLERGADVWLRRIIKDALETENQTSQSLSLPSRFR